MTTSSDSERLARASIAALGEGEAGAAMMLAAQALVTDPASVTALRALAAVTTGQGRLGFAEGVLRRALRVTEDPVPVLCALAGVLHYQARDAEAEAVARQAIVLAPDEAEAAFQMATATLKWRSPPDVLPWFRRATVGDPNHGQALYGAAALYQRMGSATNALPFVDRAVRALPHVPDVLALGAHVMLDHGRLQDALGYYYQAIQLSPDAGLIHSNFVMALCYDRGRTARQKAAAHRLWASLHADPLTPADPVFANDRAVDRRLRIGFVSGDYTRHSIAYFLIPLLRALDRTAVEVYCYSNTYHVGTWTERFRDLADGWRDVMDLDDDVVADQIRRDRIDVLVDLSGHTAGNRLPVFARRPAPVQVSWLGYPATTGLRAMDYRITDAVADPPGKTEDLHTETLVRLPGPFLCYDPIESPPPPRPRPAQGRVTLASFNNISKVTPDVVALWSRVLHRLPEADLLLKSRFFIEPTTRARYEGWFLENGIGPERLRFVGYVGDFAGHLDIYNDVDIGLDPFPYCGTTTTCEALWMGVPVVTLSGESHLERVGASLLHHVGLADLVAEDEASYVEVVARLALDRPRLAELRATLRDRMTASPLCDAAAFAAGFEAVMRDLWRRWVASA